jgi:hypothetical protein
MKYFYAMMSWFAEFELAIARSSGRNPDDIARLSTDYQRWQAELQRERIRGLA